MLMLNILKLSACALGIGSDDVRKCHQICTVRRNKTQLLIDNKMELLISKKYSDSITPL